MKHTAQDLGIPRKTLEFWSRSQDPSLAQLRHQKKAALAALFESFAFRILELTTDEDIRAASLQERFIAIGIAVDKALLLRGQSNRLRFHRKLHSVCG